MAFAYRNTPQSNAAYGIFEQKPPPKESDAPKAGNQKAGQSVLRKQVFQVSLR
jgi:hypothetical protein